ncbi:MAG TPA: M13 family metallopeptidase N-terminal domain-containing protein, partial [Thermoplasmata archaeon]|nr:M13 family metallopeptidase N-terminal domain-containing protein [Thermoplasmata archaeon]
MDRSADPTVDFYGYATGTWRRDNPVPADKSVWGAGGELTERNYHLLRDLLDSASEDRDAPERSPHRQVGDFFASALDQDRRETQGFGPIRPLLGQIERADSRDGLVHVLAGLHDLGMDVLFQP